MGERAEWICSDPDCLQYGRKVADDSYEFYQVIQVSGGDGGDDFAVVNDTVTVNRQDAWTPLFSDNYLKPYGYRSVAELRVIYREAWPRIVAECVFKTKSCLNSVNYVCRGTHEFCEGYIAAKIEMRRIAN